MYAHMAEIFHDLNLFFPTLVLEKLFPSVFMSSTSIHQLPHLSESALSQYFALQIDRTFAWRERFTRRE